MLTRQIIRGKHGLRLPFKRCMSSRQLNGYPLSRNNGGRSASLLDPRLMPG